MYRVTRSGLNIDFQHVKLFCRSFELFHCSFIRASTLSIRYEPREGLVGGLVGGVSELRCCFTLFSRNNEGSRNTKFNYRYKLLLN